MPASRSFASHTLLAADLIEEIARAMADPAA
jgi:hypothetical protein